MDTLLDMSKTLDVGFLDQMVAAFCAGDMKVQKALVEFQDHPDSWLRVDGILEKSQNFQTKIIALNILDQCIKSRWKILPANQRDGIKTFLVNLIIKTSSEPIQKQEDSILLRKLNVVLVAVVKQAWPHDWPSFISDLVNSSKTSESLCANNMNILLLLSEEVFEYSSGEMTQDKMKALKKSLNSEFIEIFQLCDYILQESRDRNLLDMTLQTLLRFLHWIPVGYIFETKLIQTMATKFFPTALFQNRALQCLTEIGSLTLKDRPQYNTQFVQLFVSVISQVDDFTSEIDIATVYAQQDETVTTFVRHLALFICGFLKAHLDLLEQGDQMAQKSLGVALVLLLRLSRVDDVVIFKICLEYWVVLVTQLYESIKFTNRPPLLVGLKQDVNPRLRMYAKDLSELRKVMISKMSRPEEVLVCEDDNGQVVRVSMKDTDSIVLYKNMRECLIYLTHLDPQDTQETMLLKLSKQVDDSEWSWHNLNTLCWAIGSISGALTEMNEKTFLVRVIKDLLGLCENKRGKDHKAIIASNIMYVVGQYPRFLRQHWRFLKTVVNKLFEFMHEKHPGVQDMSCDTFLKIARTCRRKFVMLQKGEARPFVEDILDGLTEKIVDLEQSQIHTFYEAVATIIQSQSDPDKRNALVFRLMEVPNKAWNRIVVEARRMMEAHQNPAILWEPENVKRVVLVLKTNNRVASSLGHAYMVQLSRVYVEMLQMYQMYSQFVSMKIQENVGNSQNTLIRSMRAVKKETLKLIMSFVETCQETDKEIVFQKFIPELMTPVLQDYQRNVAEARDAEVLTLFATIASKLQRAIVPHVPAILEATMKCTLEMITKNYEDYPDHRMAFFKLIREINHEAFPALLSLNAAQFQMVIDSIVYAMKHLERNIADTGLNILLELLKNVENVDVANDFFKTYFNRLLQDLLSVLTDAFHKPGFRLQAQILAKLFNIVDSSCITSQLWQPEQGNFANNQEYVRGFVLNLIATSFKNLNRQQVEAFTNGLFHHNADLTAFKSHLRDFLVTLKEFASEGNNSDLFLEERNAQIQAQQSENQQRVMQVPGLLYQGPSSGIIPKELPENS